MIVGLTSDAETGDVAAKVELITVLFDHVSFGVMEQIHGLTGEL